MQAVLNLVNQYWKNLLIFFLLALIHMVFMLLYFPVMLDDPFIAFKYGKSLALGFGLTWNGGEMPVEGFTSPLWMLLSAFFYKIQIYPLLSAKVIGAISSMTLLFVMIFGFQKILSLTERFLGGLVLAISWDIAALSVSGMENITFTALVFILMAWVFFWQNESTSRQAVLCSLFLTLQCWLRPEGYLVAVILAAYFMESYFRRTISKNVLIIFFGGVFFGVLPLHLFRLFYFHDILPNTYWAKHTGGSFFIDLLQGLRYFGDSGAAYSIFFLISGIIFLPTPHLQNYPFSRYFGFLIFSFIAYAIKMGGDDTAAFPGLRLILPVVPVAIVLSILNVKAIFPQRSSSTIFLAMMVVFFGALQFSAGLNYYRVMPGSNNRSLRPHSLCQEARKHWSFLLHPHASELSAYLLLMDPKREYIALPWAGRVPYETMLPTIDLLGLNDKHIAKLKKKQVGIDVKYDADYVLNKRPLFICENVKLKNLSMADIQQMSSKDYYQLGALKVGQRDLLRHPLLRQNYEVDSDVPEGLGCFKRIN